MKKIINKIFAICFMIFDAFVDFLFCIRLLIDLNEKEEDKKTPLYNEYRIKNIKVLLQFLANSFDNSVFEYYCLNNEEYLYQFYLSLKYKNSGIFKFVNFTHQPADRRKHAAGTAGRRRYHRTAGGILLGACQRIRKQIVHPPQILGRIFRLV